jgi:hypothetical protein
MAGPHNAPLGWASRASLHRRCGGSGQRLGGGFRQHPRKQQFCPARVQGCLSSAYSFASAAAISSQDGARQAFHWSVKQARARNANAQRPAEAATAATAETK